MKKVKVKPPAEPIRDEAYRPVPFNDALKRILSAPPQHKTAKKKRRQKSKQS